MSQLPGEDDGPGRVLAVAAHPDDLEFGASGTITRWVDEGWAVSYVIVTSGQKGGDDPLLDPAVRGSLREAEALDAARHCGVRDVAFLRYMDSEVVDSPALRRDISREYRRCRPHRLVAMKPEILLGDRSFVNHPDHRAVGQATLDTTITGGSTGAIFPELLLEEGLEPWSGLREIWLTGPGGGPEVVDITTTVDRKIAALSAHHSQTGDWVEQFVRERFGDIGRPHGYAYAESFEVIRVRRPGD